MEKYRLRDRQLNIRIADHEYQRKRQTMRLLLK